MQGKAVLANHPIHPMLVALPIGLFVGGAVSDIISIWGDPAFWPVMSVWLIAFGVVGALLAAIFGFIDYFTAPMGATTKKTATTHMVLNLLVVALYIAAFFVQLHARFHARIYPLVRGSWDPRRVRLVWRCALICWSGRNRGRA